jgi:hypothetical protein
MPFPKQPLAYAVLFSRRVQMARNTGLSGHSIKSVYRFAPPKSITNSQIIAQYDMDAAGFGGISVEKCPNVLAFAAGFGYAGCNIQRYHF